MSDIATLWAMHRDAGYPRIAGPNAGELMTLDTVICGAITHYLDSEHGLDAQRMAMLQDCMKDLSALMPELDEAAGAYFERLYELALLLVEVHHR